MGSAFRGRKLGPEPLHKARTYIGEFEGVQPQMAGQFFAGQNAAHAISLGIQARRKALVAPNQATLMSRSRGKTAPCGHGSDCFVLLCVGLCGWI